VHFTFFVKYVTAFKTSTSGVIINWARQYLLAINELGYNSGKKNKIVVIIVV